MPRNRPEVVLRIGSHAEKEYVLKLKSFLDGVIVGANLFEATPGATASLLLKLSGPSGFYVDPMTYAFGEYVDPVSGRKRSDMDWIKSDQLYKDECGVKRTKRDFKRSYRGLADKLGAPLTNALGTNRAVCPSSFAGSRVLSAFCQAVVNYQAERLQKELEADDGFGEYAKDVRGPAAVFAPYFYVEPSAPKEWLQLNAKLMAETVRLGPKVPVHGILCANKGWLDDSSAVDHLAQSLIGTGISGVWLWFSKFYEDRASEASLGQYRRLISMLSDRMEVRSMHGGYFSLALSKYGLSGISHGVGYGEQKDVVPVIGQSTPTVNYYLPPVARKLSVPTIERAFDGLGVFNPPEFHDKVCGCAVCKGVVATSLDEFSQFGDTHLSCPEATRESQTPAAAKRCRYHFLLCRIKERDEIAEATVDDVVSRLKNVTETWGKQPSLAGESKHLATWKKVLSDKQ